LGRWLRAVWQGLPSWRALLFSSAPWCRLAGAPREGHLLPRLR
jgi:hypothetical protein